MENKVIKTSLVGHKDEVLCLDCPTSEKNKNLLISGSEDGTARVWDVRVNNCATSIRSTKLLYSPKRKPVCYQKISFIFHLLSNNEEE